MQKHKNCGLMSMVMSALLATAMAADAVDPILLCVTAYSCCPTSTLRETQELLVDKDYRKLLKGPTPKLKKKIAICWNLKDPHKTGEWCGEWNTFGMPCDYAEHLYSPTADFSDERKIAHMKNLMAIYVKSGISFSNALITLRHRTSY